MLQIFHRPVLFLLLILMMIPVFASSRGGELDDETASYQYLNQIREKAGMISFKKNLILEQSAKNHADYISSNQVIGHFEVENQPKFTGIKPENRALEAGYETRSVTENFSAGQKNAIESINGLMSAIYHRKAFLDFSKDEIGIGIQKGKQGFNYVYNMGNERLNHFCQYSIYLNEGPFYPKACKHNEKVSVAKYDQRKREVQAQNPPFTIWPPKNSDFVPAVFYEEIPDPLPDKVVSGYPISVHFNPYYFRYLRMQNFKLFRVKDNLEVKPIRFLTANSDQNGVFSKYDFALFPLERLDWDTAYRVEILFKANGKRLAESWQFKTRKLLYPLFVIDASKNLLLLKPNQTYAIYIPPQKQAPYITDLQWESTEDIKTDISWEDKNTILARLTGEKCQTVHFSLNHNRSFMLQIADSDNLNPMHDYPDDTISKCILQTVRDIPGFQIRGKGEVLELKANQDYWIEILPHHDVISQIKWQNSKQMNIHVNHLNHNTIKIRVSGSPGDQSTFIISKSKSFDIVIK